MVMALAGAECVSPQVGHGDTVRRDRAIRQLRTRSGAWPPRCSWMDENGMRKLTSRYSGCDLNLLLQGAVDALTQ